MDHNLSLDHFHIPVVVGVVVAMAPGSPVNGSPDGRRWIFWIWFLIRRWRWWWCNGSSPNSGTVVVLSWLAVILDLIWWYRTYGPDSVASPGPYGNDGGDDGNAPSYGTGGGGGAEAVVLVVMAADLTAGGDGGGGVQLPTTFLILHQVWISWSWWWKILGRWWWWRKYIQYPISIW